MTRRTATRSSRASQCPGHPRARPRLSRDGSLDASALFRGVSMTVVATTPSLLVCSNVFMTFAWYAHLRNLADKPWYVAAFASWGIALFEYLLQVPANRTGFTTLNLSQLKLMQGILSLTVFVPFALLYMKQPVTLDFLWAGLCLLGAVYFVFR